MEHKAINKTSDFRKTFLVKLVKKKVNVHELESKLSVRINMHIVMTMENSPLIELLQR